VCSFTTLESRVTKGLHIIGRVTHGVCTEAICLFGSDLEFGVWMYPMYIISTNHCMGIWHLVLCCRQETSSAAGYGQDGCCRCGQDCRYMAWWAHENLANALVFSCWSLPCTCWETRRIGGAPSTNLHACATRVRSSQLVCLRMEATHRYLLLICQMK